MTQYGQLVGVYRPRPSGPGFGIPVIKATDRYWIQQANESGQIESFAPCEVTSENLRPVDNEIQLAVGDAKRYAFEASDGTVFVEERHALAEWLRGRISELRRSPFVLQDVAEFLGDNLLFEESRRQCANLLASTAAAAGSSTTTLLPQDVRSSPSMTGAFDSTPSKAPAELLPDDVFLTFVEPARKWGQTEAMTLDRRAIREGLEQYGRYVAECVAIRRIQSALTIAVYKLEYLLLEYSEELHKTPNSLESCHRWISELVVTITKSVDMDVKWSPEVAKVLSALFTTLVRLLRECDEKLGVTLGSVDDSLDAHECETRLAEAIGRAKLHCVDFRFLLIRLGEVLDSVERSRDSLCEVLVAFQQGGS